MIVPCPACGTRNRIPEDKKSLQPKCGRCGTRLPAIGSVIELNDTNFNRFVEGASLPVMVDFYSPTCGPCRMLAPVIENLAGMYAGRVLIAKLDTSRFQNTAAGFQIRGVPTLLFFKQGKMVNQLVGAAPQPQIEQHLKALL